MKLSDVVSHAGLAVYAEIALVIFFAVFLAVVWRTFRPSKKAELEAQGRLPLDEGAPAHPQPRKPS